jgi:hypothetical protein
MIKIKNPQASKFFFDTLKSFFSRLSAWLMWTLHPSEDRQPVLQKGHQKSLPQAATTGKGKNSVIRIRTRPSDGSAPIRRSTPNPRIRATIRNRQSNSRKDSRINLDAEVRICKACGEGFGVDEQKSRCLRDSRHFVHARCTEIMRYKCPYCGGRLT